MSTRPRNAGEALILRLKSLGVDRFYANPGTEFVSIIRGFRDLPPAELPEPVLVAHELQAVSMAHGDYLATGRPQAVMTHATVGAANAVIGLIAASRMNVPLIFVSGMTPANESGAGRRDRLHHWAQDSKDPGAMYREYVKREFDVREPGALPGVLDQAYAIAMTEPRGPVAVRVSRDVLVAESPALPALAAAPAPAPAPSFDALFALLETARRPLVVTNRLGVDPSAVPLLIAAAQRHGLGVSTPDDFYASFPSEHRLHLGYKQGAALAEADVVLVLDVDVPWYPLDNGPAAAAKVAHIGPDPRAESIPLRGHRGNLFLKANPAEFLRALAAREPASALLPEREAWCATMRALRPAPPAAADGAPLTAAIVSVILAAEAGDAVLVNELGLVPEFLRPRPGAYFRSTSSSSLGWGVGCGLGLVIARPGRTAIVAVGDGVFFLSPAHGALLLAARRKIPYVLLILNNGGMRSVAAATREAYPESAGDLPLTVQALEGLDVSKTADVVGGRGARASTAGELRLALADALAFTRKTGRPAVVEARIAA